MSLRNRVARLERSQPRSDIVGACVAGETVQGVLLADGLYRPAPDGLTREQLPQGIAIYEFNPADEIPVMSRSKTGGVVVKTLVGLSIEELLGCPWKDVWRN